MQVGNWSRRLTDMFGIDADDCLKEDQHGSEDDDKQDGEAKPFLLLNDLSDLLMLPKDMLMDRSIRKEVDFIVLLLLHGNICYLHSH
jgi:hypothetical protein